MYTNNRCFVSLSMALVALAHCTKANFNAVGFKPDAHIFHLRSAQLSFIEAIHYDM